MKVRIIYLLLIIFPLLISLPVLVYFLRFPQPLKKGLSQEQILFQDDFSQLSPDWFGFNKHPGRWQWLADGGKTGGGYHHFYEGTWGEDNFAFLKNKTYTDFSFSADVRILAGNAGIQGRVTATGLEAQLPSLGGYRCVLAGGNKIKLQRYRLVQPNGQVGDHRNPLDLLVADFGYQTGQWYNQKIEFSGNTIRCYVDGVKKLEYTDSNSLTEYEISQGKTQNGAVFKSGSIGLVANAANVYFDNAVVRGVGGSGGNGGTGGRVYTEWKKDNWFGSWKWQGNRRVATQPEQDSLIIHFENQPFEVIFWDGRDGGTKMPHWRPVGDSGNFGICPLWFESGNNPDWEPLFTDRSLIKLEVLEERADYVKVRWWYKPTKDRQGTWGGTGFEVHRGNTEVEQIFEFFSNGLTQVTMNIKLGDQNLDNQSGNDMELAEWNFLYPLGQRPLDVLGREGKIVKVLDPYSSAETAMNLSGWGLDKNLANSWQGQIHWLYNKNANADFFCAWGKKVNPTTSADLYLKIFKSYYQETAEGVDMAWPKPSCNISAPLMAKAFYPASGSQALNYTYKWLIGMGNLASLDLRKITTDWLDQGIIDGDGGLPTPTAVPTVTPTPTPTGGAGTLFLSAAARFQGFSVNNQPQILLTMKAKNTGFTKDFILPESGVLENLDLTGLQAGQTYDLIFSSWGFLSIKKNITLVSGRNPSVGNLLLGTFRSGDLNGDNQINGLDWSLMKLNYGESGEE